MADIRNEFAHSHELINFDNPALKGPLADLNLPEGSAVFPPSEKTYVEEAAKTPRDKFCIIGGFLYASILNRGASVKHQDDLKIDEWWHWK